MALFSSIGLLLLFLIMSYLSLNHFSPLILLSLFCLISYIRQFWLIDYFFFYPFQVDICPLTFSIYIDCKVLLFVLSCFYGCFFLVYLNVNLLLCKLYFIMIEKNNNNKKKLAISLRAFCGGSIMFLEITLVHN